MATTLPTTFLNAFSSMKICVHVVGSKFLRNMCPSFVPVMACHRAGNKPLSELMMAWFTEVFMPHSATMI